METLFQAYTTQNIPIALVDASGSVTSSFLGQTIFDKLMNLLMDVGTIRIIFWNSNRYPNTFFQGGIYMLPFVVKKESISQTFKHVFRNITDTCLTDPHLAFECIPDEWINNKDMTRIYFLTDGEIGYSRISSIDKTLLETQLGTAIVNLFKKHNNIQLNIMSVENRSVDLSLKESVQSAAGCDVYNVIMNHHLTQYITKFISYTTNNPNGFVHINKNTPPTGFLPYGEKYFSVLKVGEFIQFIMTELAKAQTEDEQLQIVQNLSNTLATLTKDKRPEITKGIIGTFCDLFKTTKIDPMFVQLILTESIQKEVVGSASIYAEYRSQLKDLYKKADELLLDNVKNAIGLIGNKFVSLPMDGKIIIGNHRFVDQCVFYQGRTYHNAACMLGKVLVPVVYGGIDGSLSLMNQQCLRQWLRIIISKLYGVNPMDDDVIYLMLGLVLQVSLSEVSDDLKTTFRHLGFIMLRKKRMKTDMTELERLQNGELPADNHGGLESFTRLMNCPLARLGIKMSPLSFWYAVCLALGDEQLILRQLIHCGDAIQKEFQCESSQLVNHLKTLNCVPKLMSSEIPYEVTLDYMCLVTMEETSKIGGFRFLPHRSPSNMVCCLQNVLSTAGYKAMAEHVETCVCPVCFTKLTPDNFEKVGPKPDIVMEKVFSEGFSGPFSNNSVPISAVSAASSSSSSTSCSAASSSSVASSSVNVNKLDGKIKVVLMNGPVGAGKSHLAHLLQNRIEQSGGYCIIVGTDKFCKEGIDTKNAIGMVTQEILSVNGKIDTPIRCVIIDTCGDNNKSDLIFGVDVSECKKIKVHPNIDAKRTKLTEFLAWSLRNVLRRDMPNSTSSYYLSPITAGLETCIKVHTKKSQILYGKKISCPLIMTPVSTEMAISMLNTAANDYETYMREVLPLDQEVEKVFTSL